MKKWLVAVIFGTVLVLGACGGGDDSADDTGTDTGSEDGGTAVESAGEDIFKANCSACHGADLSGGAGPDLTTIGSKYSADELADIITNGIGSMPAQNVTGEDLDTLSNWLAEKK